MNYNKIRKMDISNGPGVRVSIFMQGCTFNCKNCFNPETHDFNGGKELTQEVVDRLLQLCEEDYIQGLSILGGEPLHPKNIDGTAKLAAQFKKAYPNKTVWVWTGFLWENLDKTKLTDMDVLVDGQFVEELKNPMLKYCGSSNQRVIDVQKTLKSGKITLFEENLGEKYA